MATGHRSEILFTIAILLALAVAYITRHVLLIVYVSALMAVVIMPFITKVQQLHIGRWHPGRGTAITVIGILLLGTGVVACIFALPPIFSDVQQLASELPQKVDRAQEFLQRFPILDSLSADAWQRYAGTAAKGLVRIFPSVAAAIATFFSLVILTAYFVVDGERAVRWVTALFPPHTGQRLQHTLFKAKDRLRAWLTGQLLLMLILGLLSELTYGLLHVRYFTILAVFTGLANIVPIVGPIISIALAATVAAFDSWLKMAGVLAFYAVYQQLENAFLTPRIMKETVGLPSLAVVVALAIGGTLAGILGALVAVPSAAIVAVLAEEYLIKPHKMEREAVKAIR